MSSHSHKNKNISHLYQPTDYRLVGGHLRCSICNAVSTEDISTDIGDFKNGMSFTPDPKDKNHFICIECAEVINDVKYDYELMDMEDGWQ